MAPWVRRYEDPTCRSRGGAVVRLLGASRRHLINALGALECFVSFTLYNKETAQLFA